MKTFSCLCGNRIHFENHTCLQCGRKLGFLRDQATMVAFDELPGTYGGKRYKPCANYTEHQTCNWMLDAESSRSLCFSCSLNDVIPDLSDSKRVGLWYEVEKAKRRLLYTLLTMALPIEGKSEDPNGIAFRFLADTRLDTERATSAVDDHVATGFHDGIITINLLEADASMREEMREAMEERYRTLLGHFRHESGHYYWAKLVTAPQIETFRALFGDERTPYGDAVASYYENGAPADWTRHYVAPYASAHPLEDFAETWSHYLAIVDTLETAADAGLLVEGAGIHVPDFNPGQYQLLDISHAKGAFHQVIEEWTDLTTLLNRLNRSMGMADAYPFTLSPRVVEKLYFVHQLVLSSQLNRGSS